MRWAISIFQIWLDLPWRSGQSLISLGSVTCPGACNQRSPFALTDCWLALAICQPPSPCMFCTSCSLGPGCILEKNVGWVLNLLLPVRTHGRSRKVSHFLHVDLLIVSSCTHSAPKAAISLLESQSRGRGLRFFSSQNNSEILASILRSSYFLVRCCLSWVRKGGVETGLLSIIHNPYPLLSMHQPEEWPFLAILSCLIVHDVLLFFSCHLIPSLLFLLACSVSGH